MNLVFIHIGKKNIDYVEHSLNQAILFNPKIDFFLISNEELYYRIKEKIYKKINFIDYNKLEKSREHLKFLSNTKLDKLWNNGFWLHTTERFFYLDNICKLLNLRNIFHVENDIMLYFNLYDKLKIFEDNYDIGLTFENLNKCVPSFTYFKDYQHIGLLTKFIYKKNRFFFQKKLNDMQLLALFYKHNDNKNCNINILPTMSKNMMLKNVKKKNLNYFNNYQFFNGIFDAANFGLYLDGFDKTGVFRNQYINHKLWAHESSFDFEKYKIFFEKNKGLKTPYILVDNEKVKIFNLHIHSKNLYKFMSNSII